MDITPEQVRAHRAAAHHLDRRYPASRILEAAGPAAPELPARRVETALFQRHGGLLPPPPPRRPVPGPGPAPGLEHPGRAPGLSRRGERRLSLPPSGPGGGVSLDLHPGSPRLDFCRHVLRRGPRPGCGRPPAAWTGPPSAARRPWTSCWLTGVGGAAPAGTAGPVGLPLHGTAALTGRPWEAPLSPFSSAPAPLPLWWCSAAGRRTVPPLPPSAAGWAGSPPPALRGRRSWCGDFSTATAPPPPPISRPGWAALPNRRSGSGPPPQRRWNRSGCWAGPAGP